MSFWQVVKIINVLTSWIQWIKLYGMEILFKTSNHAGKDATVSNSNFREHYAAVNANTDWKTLVPAIRQATEAYLIPHISQVLYDSIVDDYQNAEGSLTDVQRRFIQKCQDVVAFYAILSVSPELLISISNMGLVDKGSSNSPVTPIPQWRYKSFRYELSKKADQALDALLELLEKNVHQSMAYFMPWVEQPEYVDTRSYFFSNAKDFSRFVNINGSRRMFSALKADIERMEERVEKIICLDQFNRLREAVRDGDATDDEQLLLQKIRRYVAAAAVADAASLLNFTVDNQGLLLSSYTDGLDAHGNAASAFRGAELTGAFILQLQKNSGVYWSDLVNFVMSHIDTYPLIKDSDCYEAITDAVNIPTCNGPGGAWLG